MASKVEIVNQGLILIGEEPILSLTEDSTQAARANAIFNATRDEVLADHFWDSASRKTKLAKLEESPSWGFDNVFQLPSDYIKLYPNEGDLKGHAWEINGRKLHTDLNSPIKVRYVYRVEDPNEFSAGISWCVSVRLAWKLAITISGDSKKANEMFKLYREDALPNARYQDAVSSQNKSLEANEWVESRLGGGAPFRPIVEVT